MKVPVNTSTTRQNRAISPSRNVQWSGNTLRSARRAKLAVPSRSSRYFRLRSITMLIGAPPWGSPDSSGSWLPPIPERRADRLVEVAERHQYALVVDAEGQLRQRPRGRPEERLGAVEHVELRLVAGAQQRVGGRPVQAHRAAGVGADLGVGDVGALRDGGQPVGWQPQLPLGHVDEQRLGVGRAVVALREHRDEAVL